MTLLIFTSAYPYCNYTEDVFLRSELDALTAEFDRIILVPRMKMKTLLPVNIPGVEVDFSLARHPMIRCKALRLPWLFHRSSLTRLPKVFKEEKKLKDKIKGAFFTMNTAAFGHILSKIVKRHDRGNGMLLYSYWFDLIPDALAESTNGRYPIVTRAHRYDIFDDQVPYRSHSLRRLTLRQLQRVFTVSRDGLNYMTGHYPDMADKIELATLGSSRNDETVTPPSDPGSMTLLSVSRVADVKRVDRCLNLVRRLANTYPSIAIHWIHVGDGPAMSSLRRMATDASPSNLEIELLGALPNRAVHNIYHSRPIDWFMLLSDSEGLPVSICEAMSYGVPVIATDVGGIAEAVNPDTGIVLPADTPTDTFVGEMQPYIASRAEFMALRCAARQRWVEAFDSEKHSARFAIKLKEISTNFTPTSRQ